MNNIPDFHDGFFDGLWISDSETIHLFLRTLSRLPFTLVLKGVKVINVSNVKLGNVIAELVVLDSQKLTTTHICEAYHPFGERQEAQAEQMLSSARREGLSALQISSSYGAECTALFRLFELRPNHTPMTGE